MAEAPPPHNLPEPSTHRIGREWEIGEVQHLLSASRLVTLTGPAGRGKSRLAMAVAAALRPEFPHGVWWVELGSLAESEWLPQTVMAALGVREQPGQPPLSSLRDYLRTRRLLLVLDACEHLLPDCARLAETLLAACPRLRILLTSREPVEMDGCCAWPVPPLSLPDPALADPHDSPDGGKSPPGTPGDVPHSDAVRLFIDRATAARPGFALAPEDTPAVDQLCRRLEGNALAIVLAAAWVRWLPPRQILLEMGRHEERLARRQGQARPGPLDLLLDWCFRHLTEPERRLLRRLSVFEGGCTEAAAREVCGRGGVPEAEVAGLLQQLVQRSLLVERRAAGPPGDVRYQLPGAVQRYARERLAGSREARVVGRLHLEWCLGLPHGQAEAMRGAGQAAWLARLEAEHDNVRAALRRCREGRNRAVQWRLVAFLWWFWYAQGHMAEGEARSARLLRPRLDGPPQPSAEGGRVDARARASREGLMDAVDVLWPVGLGGLLLALGIYWLFLPAGILSLLRFGIRGPWFMGAIISLWFGGAHLIERTRSRAATRASVLYGSGVFAEARGDYASARECYARCLRLYRINRRHESAAHMLIRLGHLDLQEEHTTRAQSLYQKSLRIARRYRLKEDVAEALAALGVLHHHEEVHPRYETANAAQAGAFTAFLQGDLARSRSLFEEGLSVWRELNQAEGIAGALTGLGHVALAQGDTTAASRMYSESLAIAARLDSEVAARPALIGLGDVALAQGHLNSARIRFDQATVLAEKCASQSSVAIILLNLGHTTLAAGDLETAAEQFNHSLTIARELDDERLIPMAMAAMGRIARRREDRIPAQWMMGARTHFRESLRRFHALGHRMEIAAVLEEMAALEADDGRPELAAHLWGAAAGLRETIGAPLPPVERPDYDRTVSAARAALDEAAFAAAWQAGLAEPVEEVVAGVLEDSRHGDGPIGRRDG